MTTEIDAGGPFDRVRAALVAEYCSPAVDKMNRSSALAALAEIEREIAEQVQASARLASERACEMVRADKAERECAFQAEELRRISAQRDQFLADAAFAEKECDELRAKLAEIEQHHQFTPADNYADLLRQFRAMHNVLRARELEAHPLAMREPSDEECREIWRAIRRTTATDQISGGRAMWQAVREVMTK